MKITRIEIKNFRLLQDFTIELEHDLSLVIGKNNSGKTSFLTVLDKFLNASEKNKFTYDDFNIELKNKLIKLLSGAEVVQEEDYIPIGISLSIDIGYDETDDLSNVNQLIMSLDPNDNHIVLEFDYVLSYAQLSLMCKDFNLCKDKFENDPALFLSESLEDYFGSIGKKSVSLSDPNVFTDLVKEKIGLQDVISFKYISAKRSVTNKDTDKTLSTQTASIYKKSAGSIEQEATVAAFKKKLRETDQELSGIYQDMFEGLLKKVSRFGGLKESDTQVKIASTLQHRELLEGNTTVLYSHGTHQLPEYFNGLGYMNLISMIFEIEMLMTAFRGSSKEKPAAINLLFIEEPEAHTHPQMQYVFIKNIKSLLLESRSRDDGLNVNLQTIISTHSSHIVAECDFDDIKYFSKEQTGNGVKAKSLRVLQEQYFSDDPTKDAIYKQHYKFLKQYLTLNRAELFFADKAILVEGPTEKVLLPSMMKKFDLEKLSLKDSPLLSQNISIVEVGAHSQIFEKFIDFFGLKTLIITDIDSYYNEVEYEKDNVTPKKHKNGNDVVKSCKCPPNDSKAKYTSNGALRFYHGNVSEDLVHFKNLNLNEKILKKKSEKWIPDINGNLLMVYQTEEDGYHARSFEDAFFSINKNLLGTNPDNFPSLTPKWFKKYVEGECDVFEFAENAVGSKPSLAIEILLNSKSDTTSDYSNWKTPSYIEEGLEWLCKQ